MGYLKHDNDNQHWHILREGDYYLEITKEELNRQKFNAALLGAVSGIFITVFLELGFVFFTGSKLFIIG